MAKMIPSAISPDVKSHAERHLFSFFRDAPHTEDWIVLHSLGISNHNKVIHGETDFFVLVPYMGLFALEVKGGRVRRKDGVWTFTDKYGNTDSKERGPFDQAWDGIHSIVDDIKKKLDPAHQYLQNIFYGIGVMFPDVEYMTVSCDEEQWQVFDCNDGNNVYDYICRLFNGACQKWKSVYKHDVPVNKLPSVDDVRYIASLLRGDFDKALAISAQIRYSEAELVRLTDEQYRCIDQLEDNKRCLIEGGAGTGKTLLAIKEAENAVANGLKVALFCFNKNLGDWFEKSFDDNSSNLRPAFVGTFHKYLIRIIKQSGMHISFPRDDDDMQSFYSDELPEMALVALTQLRDNGFDKIIVDEAQDLITERYLNVFNRLLAGGLARGRWTFLGDFSQQAIYNTALTGTEMKDLIESRTSYIRFKLTINCRNTNTICDEIGLVTGYKAAGGVWSKVDGVPVQYLTYSDREEEKAKLESTIQDLIEGHISPKNISILSPVRKENSIVSEIDSIEIKDYKIYSNNKLAFSTIQSFKGLENVVIILVDIESLSDRQLMYVALSRARSALYVIESDDARKEYLDMQMRRLTNGHET